MFYQSYQPQGGTVLPVVCASMKMTRVGVLVQVPAVPAVAILPTKIVITTCDTVFGWEDDKCSPPEFDLSHRNPYHPL